jgi:hypothetical protein
MVEAQKAAQRAARAAQELPSALIESPKDCDVEGLLK